MTLLLLLLAAAPPDEVRFPGPVEARDPTGTYAVVCVTPDPGARGEARHELVLAKLRSGERRRLLTFTRRAAVLWAPDGSAIAVTERPSSHASTLQVFFPQRPGARADMGTELTRSFGAMPELLENGHVFLEAVRWLDAATLRFRLRGYGTHDPEGFDQLFDYTVGGSVRRATGLPLK